MYHVICKSYVMCMHIPWSGTSTYYVKCKQILCQVQDACLVRYKPHDMPYACHLSWHKHATFHVMLGTCHVKCYFLHLMEKTVFMYFKLHLYSKQSCVYFSMSYRPLRYCVYFKFRWIQDNSESRQRRTMRCSI